MMKKRAVFLDRDGTINKDVGYPSSFSMVEIYPYSFEAIKKINEAGLLAIIVSNQSGVGRGLIVEKDLKDIHQKLRVAFAKRNAHLRCLLLPPLPSFLRPAVQKKLPVP